MPDWSVPDDVGDILSKPAKIWGSDGIYSVFQFVCNYEWHKYFCAHARRRLHPDLVDDNANAVQNAMIKMFTGERPDIFKYEPDEKIPHGVRMRNYIMGNINFRCADINRVYKKRIPKPKKTETIQDSIFRADYLAQKPYAKRLVEDIFNDEFNDEPSYGVAPEDTLIELEDMRSEFVALGGSGSRIDEVDENDDITIYRQQLEDLIKEEHYETFRECISALSQRDRDVVDMRAGYFGPDFVKNKNIAQRLDISPGNVAVIFGRAIKAIIRCTDLKKK